MEEGQSICCIWELSDTALCALESLETGGESCRVPSLLIYIEEIIAFLHHMTGYRSLHNRCFADVIKLTVLGWVDHLDCLAGSNAVTKALTIRRKLEVLRKREEKRLEMLWGQRKHVWVKECVQTPEIGKVLETARIRIADSLAHFAFLISDFF